MQINSKPHRDPQFILPASWALTKRIKIHIIKLWFLSPTGMLDANSFYLMIELHIMNVCLIVGSLSCGIPASDPCLPILQGFILKFNDLDISLWKKKRKGCRMHLKFCLHDTAKQPGQEQSGTLWELLSLHPPRLYPPTPVFHVLIGLQLTKGHKFTCFTSFTSVGKYISTFTDEMAESQKVKKYVFCFLYITNSMVLGRFFKMFLSLFFLTG